MQKESRQPCTIKAAGARMGCMSEKNNAVNASLPADTSSIPYLMCIGKQVSKEFLWPETKRAHSPALSPTTAPSGGSRQTEQSIEGQRRDCEAYVRAHGMTILREYVDRHISGKTDDRAQFRQMIDDSAKRTFDLVICWKTDRFARNRYDSAVVQKAAA